MRGQLILADVLIQTAAGGKWGRGSASAIVQLRADSQPEMIAILANAMAVSAPSWKRNRSELPSITLRDSLPCA